MWMAPLPNRRSSSSSRSTRTPRGSAGLPPPTTTANTNRWTSSTSPAANACWARPGPPTVRSRSVASFMRRTASGSNSRSSRVGRRHGVGRPGVDDLVGRPPHLGEVELLGRRGGLLGRRAGGFDADRLPDGHRLVHAPAVEVGADRPLEVVDERVDLGVGNRPAEPAALVLDVAVEGRDRRVGELGHGASVPGVGTPVVTAVRRESVHPRSGGGAGAVAGSPNAGNSAGSW